MADKDNRAKVNELAELHGVFAKCLSDKLKSGEVTGPELNCIRQFLKDNGIDCVGTANEDINSIAEDLPAFDQTDGEGDRILM